MLGDLDALLALHDKAAAYGCRLKPDLEAKLRAHAAPPAAEAIRLPVRAHSAGPAVQAASEDELRAAGVSVLRRPPDADDMLAASPGRVADQSAD